MVTQVIHYTVNGRSYSGAFSLFGIALAFALALIPAAIASRKGRSFLLWYLFGFLCFLPALIVSLVIADRTAPSHYGDAAYGQWGGQPGGWTPPSGAPPPPPPTSPPAGWYPDPGGSGSQRYWDGFRWTDHLR